MANSTPRMSNSPNIRFSCLLFLLLQHLFSVGVNSFEYDAEELGINCGSSENSTSYFDNTRSWIGDKDPNDQFSLIENGKDSVDANTTEFNSIDQQYPYCTTARLSHSRFTYSIRVTEGPKFIRLHFFPSTYDKFEPSNSLFSVTAGRFTLLKDFNPLLTAKYDDDPDEFVSREYCINVDQGQTLNITFIPSLAHPDCYAFINGIEVVSMPPNLYFPEPGGRGLNLVGYDKTFMMENRALQTMYRINAGGPQIPPNKDTGMYRHWDDDDSSLEVAHNISVPVNYWPKNYTLTHDYTAPVGLYITARTYGKNAISKYNVTWNFKVDPQFTYMVRLHFCEIDLEFNETNQRVFQIFIADKLAEDRFDVLGWTIYNMVPIYKDYAVILDNSVSLKPVKLSIKLQPVQTQFAYDVILNGIEIFKVSDNDGNLTGLNPEPRLSPPELLAPPTKPPKSSKATLVATIAGAGSGIVIVSFMCFLIFRRTTRSSANDGKSKAIHISLVPSKSSKSPGSSLPSDLCRYFSLAEIRAATNNFDDVFVIGRGGFGMVYKGNIDGGITPVAVKRLKPGSQQGVHEFETEIEMLSQLRHLHLVSLIGYCNEANEMILVYDFMARGTLREHLYDSDNQPLSWKQRLEICLGAARGLHYLHTGVKHNIIHRDVKTTNILLDEKWLAKVSDFGLSKIGPTGMSKSHISTVVKGSLGYLDPEYYKRQHLTLKSDVYSFGVVLLEVLCGRPSLLRTTEKHQVSLVDWVRKCHKNGEIDRMVDPFLRRTITPQCLNNYVDMALKCLLEDGNQRPSMNDVVWGLEFAMQLQESMEGTMLGGTIEVDEKKGEERALLTNTVNVDVESDILFTSTGESSTRSGASKMTTTSSEEQTFVPGMVFSELLDPTAR